MRRYYSRIWIGATIALLLSISVANAIELRFNEPPRFPAFMYDYPYQRNIMIDFGWDPGSWPADANIAGAKELSPGAESDFFVGFDDPVLYEPDWFSFDANFEQYWTNSIDVPGRQGFIGINNREDAELSFSVYLNNDPKLHARKAIYVELEYYSSDFCDITDHSIFSVSPSQNVPFIPGIIRNLGDGWSRASYELFLIPNPEGEKLTWTLPCGLASTTLIDYIHIATEAVTLSGDIDKDGFTRVTDVIQMQNYIVENVPTIGTCADINNDGSIDVVDVVRALNMIVGNIPYSLCDE
jgi:hypothetical protein